MSHGRDLLRRWECLQEHGDYIARHLPFVLQAATRRGLAAPVGHAAEDIIMTCAWCCDDEAWDFEGGAIVRWFYCGPLGLNCECIDDDPPDE